MQIINKKSSKSLARFLGEKSTKQIMKDLRDKEDRF